MEEIEYQQTIESLNNELQEYKTQLSAINEENNKLKNDNDELRKWNNKLFMRVGFKNDTPEEKKNTTILSDEEIRRRFKDG